MPCRAVQIKFFETVGEATSQIEVATRQYDRAISPVDEGNVAVRILGACVAALRRRAGVKGPTSTPVRANQHT